MPRSRQPPELWQARRLHVLERDGYACVRCATAVTVETAHIDHIVSGKQGSNDLANLRTLCYRCHVLRLDGRHRGMVGAALRRGVIPADYRRLMWSDDELK